MTPRSSAASSSSRWLVALVVALTALPAHAVDKSAKEEAAAISQVATAKHQSGEFALCAELFHQAYDKDPTYLPYLFSAARCLHKKGDLDGAERDYRQFLARSPKGGQLTDKAQEFLDQLLEARKKADAAKAAEPKKDPEPVKAAEPARTITPAVADPPLVAHQPAPEPLRPLQWAGYAMAAVGAIGAVVGAIEYAGARNDRAALADQLQPKGALVTGMTQAEALQRDDAWRSKAAFGSTLGGIGAAMAICGGYLALSSPPKVAVGPDGVLLAWRW